MIYSIIFLHTEEKTSSGKYFIRSKTKSDIFKGAVSTSNINVNEIFIKGGYLKVVKELRGELDRLALSFLETSGQGYVIRKRRGTKIAIQNYIAEVGLIVPVSRELSYKYPQFIYFKSKEEKVKYLSLSLSFPFPFPKNTSSIFKAVFDTHFSLTARIIFIALLERTNLITKRIYITCSELSRVYDIPRASIDTALNSPEVKELLIKRKVDGCKEFIFEWTEKGQSCFDWDSYIDCSPAWDQLRKCYASEDYEELEAKDSFDVRITLTKLMSDECKKVLNGQCKIPELKVAAEKTLGRITLPRLTR